MFSRKVNSLRVFAPAGRGYARGNVICYSVFGNEVNAKGLHQFATQPKFESEQIKQNELSTPLSGILPNILANIGNTPLVKINRIAQEEGIKCDLLAKCEYQNPGGSLKDRVALRMIMEAEKEGKLRPGMTIIEPTSGNTGISVALAGAVMGYKCILCITDKMTQEKVDTMTALGATVLRASKLAHEDSPDSHIGLARKINKALPGSLILNQYDNPMNPMAHYDSTAEEIIQACNHQLDMVVLGAGTCGTLVGIARKMKERLPHVQVVAVDPVGSLLDPKSDPKCTDPFLVEGIGHKFLPGVYDSSVVDKWVKIRDAESFNMARRLIRSEGMLIGGSSGAVLVAALRAAKNLNRGQKCVVVLPDGIRNYLTHFVSNDWMAAQNFPIEPIRGQEWRHQPISTRSVSPAIVCPIANMTVEQAIEKMRKNNKSYLVAKNDSGQCFGVLSLANLEFAVKEGKHKATLPVSAIICLNIATTDLSATLGTLADLFTKRPYILVSKEKDEAQISADQLAGVIDPEIVFLNTSV